MFEKREAYQSYMSGVVTSYNRRPSIIIRHNKTLKHIYVIPVIINIFKVSLPYPLFKKGENIFIFHFSKVLNSMQIINLGRVLSIKHWFHEWILNYYNMYETSDCIYLMQPTCWLPFVYKYEWFKTQFPVFLMIFNIGNQVGQNLCPEKLRPLICFIGFITIIKIYFLIMLWT